VFSLFGSADSRSSAQGTLDAKMSSPNEVQVSTLSTPMSENVAYNEIRKPKSRKEVASYLFKYLLVANLIQYLEAGAVPAQLISLSNAFNMGHGQQGLLGGVVYIALSCGGPFAGYLLRRYADNHRRVIGTALIVNNFFTLLWALTPVDLYHSKLLFISLRFAMGLTQCVMCVYLPLWINEYAPSQYRTSWMSYLQASCMTFLFPADQC
jgi:MFS family permease